ncbi:PI31 proteasome regulator N-terminal-domain-containing protein [Kockovaella imperatae]|uniref:PI31 proteasome regulator N-terminal-domain-containing protein n=1 Tax=Kockovaella imperatae TaxID=4999 RepID=A0A1Y1UFU0_9TREE|nr:PI31 proteasome regulator N-terminal-domain-containing protein [Kockovaella imperatae]ORX36839.1 PI31 proteasome regulator N-terminal-domain-containing protein [Kockovaella imperatae]
MTHYTYYFTMANPLDPGSLLDLLTALLPSTTSSRLSKPTDALAALIHAIHTALDFRLVRRPDDEASAARSTSDATGPVEEKDIDDTASETTTAVDQEDEEEARFSAENQLPSGWSDRGEDSYSFEYKHDQSSMTFRIRVGRMGGRIQIDAMAEDGAPHTISLLLTDILNPSAFPIPGSATAGTSSTSQSPDGPAKRLGFQSLASVSGFVEQYKKDIIAKLLPGLRKEGYVETSSGSGPRNPPPSAPSHVPSPARPDPLMDPIHPSRSSGAVPSASVGHRDLDPFASMQPPGSFNPYAGGDGGGMYMGPNHPLLSGRRDPTSPLGQGGGPEGFHPPGARWDPVGPTGPGGSGSRFPGPGGNPLGGRGLGDDGWGDELPPPGEFGPDMGRLGGRGGRGGLGGPGMPGMGPGFGGGFGGGRGGGGGGGGGFGGGGFGGGGGMYM